MNKLENKYINQYKKLHKLENNYGNSANKYEKELDEIFKKFQINTVLDYGAGKQRLKEFIESNSKIYIPYDPAIASIAYLDKTLDYNLVINFDVLEHIPDTPECLDKVILDITNLSCKSIISIFTKQSIDILPNGENAHCTVHNYKWWIKKFKNLGINDFTVYQKDSNIIIFLIGFDKFMLTNKQLYPKKYLVEGFNCC